MAKRIKNLLGRGKRLNVSIDEVRQFRPKLSAYIVRQPIEAISAFEEALNAEIKNLKDDVGGKSEKAAQQADSKFPTKTEHYYVNFQGNIGKNYVTPRGLWSELVNKFVQVQGIVTKMSIVKPKI